MEKGKNKVIVVLVDGMRPDGMMQTNHPFLETIKARFSYSLTAQTVMPSVTLFCSRAAAPRSRTGSSGQRMKATARRYLHQCLSGGVDELE